MTGVRYALLAADGTVTVHTEPLPSLATLQRLVGGYIDVVMARGPDAPDGVHLVVNDEGLADGLPVNELASRLYYSPDYPLEQRYGIRGDVVAVRVDPQGDTASLTGADVQTIQALAL